MNNLTSVSLPRGLSNTDEMLKLISSMNPLLKSIFIRSVFRSNKKKIFDTISSLFGFSRLIIFTFFRMKH